jgi:uncharacterized protein
MISRPDALKRIETTFQIHPAVALLGPRQCGKTTLARIKGDGSLYFSSILVVAPSALFFLKH